MLVHQRVSNESLRIAQKNLLVGKVENLTQSHRSCTVEPSVRLKPNEGHFGSHWRQWYLTFLSAFLVISSCFLGRNIPSILVKHVRGSEPMNNVVKLGHVPPG